MTEKERYATDPEYRERVKAAALARYYANREHALEVKKAWRERNRERIRAQSKEWRDAHPEEVRAQWRRAIKRRWADPEGKRRHLARCNVGYAVKTGTLIRPDTCSKCGGGGPIEAHHDDYDLPLEVIWLCQSCHRALPEDGA